MADARQLHATEVAIVEEVLAVIRHDVRNKLAAARQAAQYLKRRTEGTEVFKTDARVERFFNLVDEQLELADQQLSRHEALERVYKQEKKALDPQSVVAAAVAEVGPSCPVSVDVAPGTVFGDEFEIIVALCCLVSNACRAADGKGIRIRGEADASMYSFLVEDDGPGLKVDAFRKILRGPERVDGRRGLGLPIARRVAVRNAGTLKPIDVEVGTCMSLSFPSSASP